jgi:RimJ/RimL family protein N-acetyltransferase
MYGPVITAAQFRLRPPRLDDAEAMITWFEDMEVTSRITERFPPSLEWERAWLQRLADDPSAVLWAIEHDGRAIGSTAIVKIDWINQHGTTGTLIGDRSLWGRGIGGELMRVRADYAFTHLPLRKLKSSFIEGNEGSRRAQRAAGYREVGRLREEVYRDGRWLDMILTELHRSEWQLGSRRTPAP